MLASVPFDCVLLSGVVVVVRVVVVRLRVVGCCGWPLPLFD